MCFLGLAPDLDEDSDELGVGGNYKEMISQRLMSGSEYVRLRILEIAIFWRHVGAYVVSSFSLSPYPLRY